MPPAVGAMLTSSVTLPVVFCHLCSLNTESKRGGQVFSQNMILKIAVDAMTRIPCNLRLTQHGAAFHLLQGLVNSLVNLTEWEMLFKGITSGIFDIHAGARSCSFREDIAVMILPECAACLFSLWGWTDL